jgi:hypothetical protein
VNGVFFARWKAFPEELWNWERFDKFILVHLYILMSDEFLSGELPGPIIE